MPAAIALCGVVATAPAWNTETYAAELNSLRLKFEYVNDFAIGYDSAKHVYKNSFIQSAITEPKSRPIKASVCNSLPKAQIRTTSRVDGKSCQPREVRLAPGAASFVWTLRGKHSLLNRSTNIQTVRRDLRHLSREPDGSGCIPLQLPKAALAPDNACQVSFDVPLRTAAGAGVNERFSIHFEALDEKGTVIESRSREFGMPGKVPLIVSVGDSFASGEGNPDVRGKSEDDNFNLLGQRDCEDDTVVMYARDKKPEMSKKPRWLDDDYHRSLQSGPALAAKDLLKEWPYVHFISLGQSGATVYSGNRKNDIIDQVTYAGELLNEYPVDVLLITAGGNDVGFSNVLEWLTKDFKRNSIREANKSFNSGLRLLGDNDYPALARVVRKLNVKTIFISEYPNALFNNRAGRPTEGCGIFKNTGVAKVSRTDARAITALGKRLNAQVADSARQFGWRFVSGLTESFSKHGYCTGKQSYFRSAEDSCDFQGDFKGTMHPNERGTAIYANILAAEMRKVLPKSDVPTAAE
ncbi:lysophospholipase L1-like esterase [Mesorhizobium shonense]|uniref:Lysophospholipase L1-like esterase n=1 Tax=Mesorhizobium shonense TaxID=1209948 RepID=A0ABV2HVP6_9HYPH